MSCTYQEVCKNFGKCPPNHGDATEDYSCLEFKGESSFRVWLIKDLGKGKDKIVQVPVDWHTWETIKEYMKKHQCSIDEAFANIFDQWTRLDYWLEHDDELKEIWDSILDEERLRARDAEEAGF